jgi:ribokinase
MNHELLVAGQIAKDTISGKERFGGSASIIAVNSHRLGLSTGLLSVIGRDSFSKGYQRFLEESGVFIDLVSKDLESLPECEVHLGKGGSYQATWHDNECRPAMAKMKVDFSEVSKYPWVHFVSCPPGLVERVSSLGIKISLEPGPPLLSDSEYLNFLILEKSSLLFFSENEYQAALEITGYKSPKDFIAESQRILVVTKGQRGSDIFRGDHSQHVEPVAPSQVLDPTGAGDCYKSGFLSGYIRGRSLRECALIGSLMGAACVTQLGGILSQEFLTRIKDEYL